MITKIISFSIYSLLGLAIFAKLFAGIDNSFMTGGYNFISVNQIKMFISNNGRSSVQKDHKSGFLWPGGKIATKPLLESDGLVWGGKVNGRIVVGGSYLGSNALQSGKIFDDGKADDPQKEGNRIYKIKKGWETMPFGIERDQYEKNYNEWPVLDGAPWIDIDGDGIFTRGVDQPDYIGDEILWFVANDLDTNILSPYRDPIGLEFHTFLYGFNRTGILGDVVFRKTRIINKSNYTITDMYIGLNSFITLGNENDNYVGCDTSLNMAFGYNVTNNDAIYGTPPPALGHLLLQGPTVKAGINDSAYYNNSWIKGAKNLPMTSFLFYYKTTPNDSNKYTSLFLNVDKNFRNNLYNNLSGLLWSGYEIINPNTLNKTKYMVSGDPVTGIGWYEGSGWNDNDSIRPPYFQGQRIYLMSTGPFTLAPFDTQEVVIATIAAQGTDHLNSVTELKRRAAIIKKAYEADFNLTPAPPVPKLTALPMQNKITLWWDDKAEEYDKPDPFILEQGYSDTTYTFEGYRIWQYRDKEGREPKQVAIFDVKNNISVIEDYIIANGISVKAPVIMGNDEGIQRYMTIEDDIYTGERLRNGTPYYFGVTSYAYSKESSPTFLESEHSPIEVIPGREKIDYSSPYKQWDVALAEQVEGSSEADVIFKVVDPSSLTGDGYEVLFRGPYDTLEYSVINLTSGDTLYKWEKDFTLDTLSKRVTEGFMVLVNNIDGKAIMSLRPEDRPYGVKRVYEVIGTDTLGEVYQQKNSSGEWQLESRGTPAAGKQNYDIYNSIGYEDYEIRFTEGGSEYYTTGYGSNALFRNDPKGKGRVPFEVWNRTTGKRLKVKVWDRDLRDTMWTRDANSRRWEAIYAYESEEGYSEPLPELSGITKAADYRLGNIEIEGEIPKTGTSIYIDTYRPLIGGDRYRVSMERANLTDKESGRERIGEITVFPNPYMGYSSLERGREERFMRFTGMPTEATVRIYTLAGVFVRRIEKNEYVQWLDWDMRNEEGRLVSSGIYIAHIEMPGIGEKILKLAVVMEQQYLDRR